MSPGPTYCVTWRRAEVLVVCFGSKGKLPEERKEET